MSWRSATCRRRGLKQHSWSDSAQPSRKINQDLVAREVDLKDTVVAKGADLVAREVDLEDTVVAKGEDLSLRSSSERLQEARTQAALVSC